MSMKMLMEEKQVSNLLKKKLETSRMLKAYPGVEGAEFCRLARPFIAMEFRQSKPFRPYQPDQPCRVPHRPAHVRNGAKDGTTS
ncbi:hypothetical protein F2Q68_00004921 [Brassica cretica]|uniref:Uncharacterized protein n=1 Tax=Brassica cretica TaxID=69181 RepID=A0A8S9J6P2_BRACR|nr:hypothetical protein F2Q68_00004921 [Brassica cretica]